MAIDRDMARAIDRDMASDMVIFIKQLLFSFSE